jgi:uncharacterized protein YutE (UPF0331/DUF86 family)
VDRQVIGAKLEALRHCVQRVAEKAPATAAELANDEDSQDIIALNLTRAVQVCVDIAAHAISEANFSPPGTMAEAFDTLCQMKLIDASLAERMKKAVGFGNVAVHSYQDIDWAVVDAICKNHLDDFRAFASAIADRLQ